MYWVENENLKHVKAQVCSGWQKKIRNFWKIFKYFKEIHRRYKKISLVDIGFENN